MNQDSLVIVVDSNRSRQIFPGNSSSNFSNQLNKVFDFSGHEVALIKLFYHDKVDVQVLPLSPIPKTGSPFYDIQHHQNLFYVNETLTAQVNFKKRFAEFNSFISQINNLFSVSNISANFQISVDSEGKPKTVTLFYAFDYGYSMFFGELSTILGFGTQKGFTVGQHVASNPPDLEKFNQLPLTHDFFIQRSKWKMTTILLPQLYDPTLDEICISITTAAAEKGYRVAAIVNDEDNTLTVNTFSNDIYVTFSTFLNDYMKLPVRHGWNGLSTHPVPREIINPHEILPGNYISGSAEVEPPISTKVIVSCGLSLTNYLEAIPLQLLQVFARQISEEEIIFEPLNPIYFPVTQFETGYINIQLCDENQKLLPELTKPTLAVLHFRRKLW